VSWGNSCSIFRYHQSVQLGTVGPCLLGLLIKLSFAVHGSENVLLVKVTCAVQGPGMDSAALLSKLGCKIFTGLHMEGWQHLGPLPLQILCRVSYCIECSTTRGVVHSCEVI
jgi:hypothetical protein